MISYRSAPGSTLALTDSELAEPRGFFLLRHNSPTLSAVLVDAAFFLKRATRIYGQQTPEAAARQLHRIALDHLNDDHGHRVARLYRIFVYVDMRIGLDIASLAYKRQINQLVLISGDSDFVPAAKLARREGIDFILDPMWATIRPDLHEHIDGLKSVCPKPERPH
jgi:uncharacterized LabA/DUF88 family protein